MNEAVLTGLGLLSGLLMAVCGVPYIRDILRHKTKPERATWWVWLGLGIMATIAQFQAGATWSVAMTIASVMGCGTIAFLSLRYGYGAFKVRDMAALFVAAAGMAVSYMLHSPLVALLIIIGVDLIGYSLTIAKTWHAPETETLSTWFLGSVAGLLGFLAVGSLSFAQIVYPLYILIANLFLVFIIIYRRRVTQ